MIPIFVINLDRETERWAHMLEEAAALDLSFERVPAVDARTLTEADIAHWHARQIPDDWSPLLPTEIACTLSHVSTWRRIAECGEPWGFVAEDDIHLSRSCRAFFETPDWIPDGLDLIRTESVSNPVEYELTPMAEPLGRRLVRLRSFLFGGGGYFVSREAARRMAARLSDRMVVLDLYLWSHVEPLEMPLRYAQLVPPLCVQDLYCEAEPFYRSFQSRIGGGGDRSFSHSQRAQETPQTLRAKIARRLGHWYWPIHAKLLEVRGISAVRPIPFEE